MKEGRVGRHGTLRKCKLGASRVDQKICRSFDTSQAANINFLTSPTLLCTVMRRMKKRSRSGSLGRRSTSANPSHQQVNQQSRSRDCDIIVHVSLDCVIEQKRYVFRKLIKRTTTFPISTPCYLLASFHS